MVQLRLDSTTTILRGDDFKLRKRRLEFVQDRDTKWSTIKDHKDYLHKSIEQIDARAVHVIVESRV